MTPESPKLEACPDCNNTGYVSEFGPGKSKRGEYMECDNPIHRRPAPTASPALPDGVAGDVETVLDPAPLGMAPAIARYQEAARRLAAHVQSQSSTIGGLEGEVERLRGHARGMALSLEAVGFGDGGKLCTPLGRYRDEYPPSSPAHLPRTALKPVAPGKETP